jgi:antitoxin Phd
MTINTDNMVSITEANQNFSRVARLVDRTGSALVLKNNVPRYVILDFAQIQDEEAASKDEVLLAAHKILKAHLSAFQELARRSGCPWTRSFPCTVNSSHQAED